MVNLSSSVFNKMSSVSDLTEQRPIRISFDVRIINNHQLQTKRHRSWCKLKGLWSVTARSWPSSSSSPGGAAIQQDQENEHGPKWSNASHQCAQCPTRWRRRGCGEDRIQHQQTWHQPRCRSSSDTGDTPGQREEAEPGILTQQEKRVLHKVLLPHG